MNPQTIHTLWTRSFLFLLLTALSLLFWAPDASAASVTVNCSGTAGAPTAVTETDLVGDDITFADVGGDGYCELDEDLLASGNGAAASVTVDLGVTLTHPAEDVDGISIETTGVFTLNGNIDVTAKGCSGGATASADGEGPNTGTGVCASSTSGYGDGATANAAADFGGGGSHGGEGGPADSGYTGAEYGSNTAPSLLGSGGGGGAGAGDVTGGAGGGYVRLIVAGTLTITGDILADGGVGGAAVNAGGGGSGGSVHINAGTIDGAGNISADGGAGGNSTNTNDEDASGGGAGRIAVYYDTNGGFTLSNILASGGVKGSGATVADDGTAGSTFILNRETDDGAGDLRITSGLNISDGLDVQRTNITIDSGADVYCESQATLNFTATAAFTDNGSTFDCSDSVTTLNITAGTTLTTTNVTWTFSAVGTTNIDAATWTSSGTNALTYSATNALMDWAIANDLTLNGFTITGPGGLTGGSANSGVITMDDEIDVSLVNTDILSSVVWTNLVDLTIDASSTINANARGCSGGLATNGEGYGPDAGTGICAVSTTGYGEGANGTNASDVSGGGAHGGAGGTSKEGGGNSYTSVTYGSNTEPTLAGSGGGAGAGTGDDIGGNGGGRVRLVVSGTLDLDGAISADGGTGGAAVIAGGGGSGGSVYLTVGTLDGAGTISADGGDGGASTNTTNEDGSGGGGGRVAIYYETNSSTFFSGMSAANTTTAGTAEGDSTGGVDGSNGTLYTFQILVFNSAVTSVSSGTTVDTLTITFNQNVDIVDGNAGDGLDVITLSASTGTCTIDNADYADSDTNTLVLNVTCSATDNTAITIDPTYTTAGSNEIHDHSGSVEMDNARTVTGTDGAGPYLLSSTPANADTGVLGGATVELTFSEAINTGSFTYTCCGTGTDPGRSGAWTVSDTVYTITPSSDWSGGDDITINITAAPDTSANAFAGAGSGAADPFTFTISQGGAGTWRLFDGGGGASEATTATLLVPNGAQTYEGGQNLTVSWSVTGNAIASVRLEYTANQGIDYTLIADEEANDGAYMWTVPNQDLPTVRVRVTGLTSDGAVVLSDWSDSAFAIVAADEEVPQVNTDEDEETEEEAQQTVATMETIDGVSVDLKTGSVFRGQTLTDVYLVKNGKRYVFPSEAVFFSYYDSFDQVLFMKDDQLRKLQLGGRVTMAPGRMIKIQSDNRVFQVQTDGTIRHIPDEATARALYGDAWNQLITDIAVTFWGDYTLGEPLTSLQ